MPVRLRSLALYTNSLVSLLHKLPRISTNGKPLTEVAAAVNRSPLPPDEGEDHIPPLVHGKVRSGKMIKTKPVASYIPSLLESLLSFCYFYSKGLPCPSIPVYFIIIQPRIFFKKNFNCRGLLGTASGDTGQIYRDAKQRRNTYNPGMEGLVRWDWIILTCSS